MRLKTDNKSGVLRITVHLPLSLSLSLSLSLVPCCVVRSARASNRFCRLIVKNGVRERSVAFFLLLSFFLFFFLQQHILAMSIVSCITVRGNLSDLEPSRTLTNGLSELPACG